MNAGCYGGETWRNVVRVEVLGRDGRFEVRTPADYAIATEWYGAPMGASPTASSPRPGSRFRPGTSRRRARTSRVARAAHRDAAAQPAERGQRFSQSGRRPRRAVDRELRAQGFHDRRCGGVGKARQLHRQSARRSEGRRHRENHRARTRNGARKDRNRPRARSAHHRDEAASLGATPMSEFGKVAVLMGGPSAEREISFLSGNAVLKALDRERRGCARVRPGGARRVDAEAASDSTASSSRCMAVSARTAPCRVRSRH